MKKIALAYSGGLDTSVILHWLKETYRAEILAVIADVGQNEDIPAAVEKARKTGASDVRVLDVREEFVRDFVLPALQGRAIYETGYLLGTALARPVIAKALVQAAVDWGAEAISHGATGKGNDQLRFELTARALAPQLKVVAPWREWDYTGRADLIAYAERVGIPVPVTKSKPYSMDANLMHISYEGGVLEDPWNAPPVDMFRLTTDPAKAPDKAEELEISFDRGVPVSPDGLAPLLSRLNASAGRHGVGRVDIVESRAMGLKSRGVYETPGATALLEALKGVESLTLDREVMKLRDSLSPQVAHLIYSGLWYSPEMKTLLNTIRDIQQAVTGTARVRLFKGSCTLTGRKAPKSLYDADKVSFETAGAWAPSDATGYIRVLGYRLARG